MSGTLPTGPYGDPAHGALPMRPYGAHIYLANTFRRACRGQVELTQHLQKDEGWRKKEEGWRMKDEGWRKKEEGRRKKDEGRRMKEEGWRMKDEGWRMKDEGRRKKDEGWRMEGWRNEGWRMKDEGLGLFHWFHWSTKNPKNVGFGQNQFFAKTNLKK